MNLLNVFVIYLKGSLSIIFFFSLNDVCMFRIKFEMFFRILRVKHGLCYYPNEIQVYTETCIPRLKTSNEGGRK